MRTRFLILGADGQLGRNFRRVLPPDQVHAATHADLDICDSPAVRTLLETLRPEVIINAAAHNQVDDCEDHPQEAFSINAAAVCHLAQEAQRLGSTLVHFSTNYVFDGMQREPYVEADPARPLSVYGLSKLAGEQAVQRYCEKHFVIRTTGLYGQGGSRSRGGNFVERMIRSAQTGHTVRVVCDQVATPTSTSHCVRGLLQLLEAGQHGLYHVTSAGQCSWAEFAQEVFRQCSIRVDVQPVTSEEFAARARRPAYSVLANEGMRRMGLPPLGAWEAALAEYLQERRAAPA
jgi:dTDP-4-dehydrorhamnose reductase